MQNFCIEQLHTQFLQNSLLNTQTRTNPLSLTHLPHMVSSLFWGSRDSMIIQRALWAIMMCVRAWASHLIAVSVQSLCASPYLSVRIHMLRAVTASQYHCTSPSPCSSLWQPEKWFTRKLCLLLKGQSINLVRASSCISWRVCKTLKARFVHVHRAPHRCLKRGEIEKGGIGERAI